MRSQTALFTHLVHEHMGPAPLVVAVGASCGDVLQRMRRHGASSVLVVGDAGLPVGILTEQDVCRRVAMKVSENTRIETVMTTPVRSIRSDDFLYHAIARMRRDGLRHLPVVEERGEAVGMLHLHDALAVAASQMVGQIDRLTHEDTFEGLKHTKTAQIEVAEELFRDTVPAPDIQALMTRINRDLHRRVVGLCVSDMVADGWGEPPVDFDVVIMGSGGRGESFLNPDQDNGFVLADYPDVDHTRVDSWYVELATRMTDALNELGFPYCNGQVMATNPVWRKSLSQWQAQVTSWIGKSRDIYLRLADIFFDFDAVYGAGTLTAELREHVRDAAQRRFFLREMFKGDEAHGVALGFFGRLKTDPLEGPNQGKINLKLTGTLPLVGAVRVLALREGVTQTSTRGRLAALHARGMLGDDEQDYLNGAFEHITNLLLRQQLHDFRAAKPVGNHVSPDALSEREKDMLVDAFRAIRAFRARLRNELGAQLF